MLGYIGTPLDETLDAEGFFRTGDGGYLDDAGRLFWEGRLTDIIKTGGANVSPLEVDEALVDAFRRQGGADRRRAARDARRDRRRLRRAARGRDPRRRGDPRVPAASGWRATRCRAMCCSSATTRSR